MIRPSVAWILYWLGDAVSRIMNLWPCEALHPYPLYNWLMLKSSDIQGDGNGPWENVNLDVDSA